MKTVTKSKSPSSVRFASKLQPRLDKATENLFYSPFSLLSALGMCAAGAKEDTEVALADLLEVSPDSKKRKAYFKALTSEINSDEDRPYELVTANALWGQKGLNFHKPFSKTVKEDYGGAFVEVDYENEPEAAVGRINDWCNENTRGKIPEIITRDFVSDDTRLILTNAIYFKGKWQKEFVKKLTKPKPFRTNGKQVQAPTMYQSGEFSYAENDDFQALDLPYVGDDLSMLVILPRGDSTEGVEADLDAAYSKALDTLMMEDKVNVSLPRFKLETDYKMGKTLKELGAGVAFSDAADFSGISDEALKISEVVHKAFVAVDEEGTEAAAATAVGMMRCTSVSIPRPPKVFNADHPFVFFIRSRNTGEVLFAGRVTNPVK